MDFSQYAAVLYSRVQRLEPENATKIIGYLLMNLQCEKELTKLAFGPDTLIISLIDSAKVNLRILSTLDQSLLSPRVNEADSCSSLNHELPGNYFHGEPSSIYHITDRRPASVQQPHVKICHYFSKGFCKNGNNCRYLHGNLSHETWPHSFVSGSTELATDDQVCSPGSMERLERELIELLKPRGGIPISIASLPMLYYEKYGRSLEVEGYLNGSHRQGDAGCNLTRLVSRLSNTIRLIDRHHGHHSIVLEEDLHKYSENVYERSGHGVIVTGSRQIYLTFPAESPFSEEDVSNYFRKFGQVEDVRIPNQQKRMFGFVTFVSPETVRQILEKGNPHFVCGSRVLVKPYREKPCRHNERKYAEKCLGPASQFLGMNTGSLSALRSGEGPGLCGRDDHEWELEIELRRLSNLQLMNSQQQLINYYNIGRQEAESRVIDTTEEGSYTQQFEYLLDILSQESSSNDEITGHTTTLVDQTERLHRP